MVSRKWLITFSLVTALVFCLKVTLAYSTAGAPDMSLWENFLAHIHECGVCVYQTGGTTLYPALDPHAHFNHPPFMIHLLRLLGLITNTLNLDFRFVFRVFTSVVDVGSVFLVYRLLVREGLFTPWRFLLYLLAPATVIISGYHGNTDTVMIFFVLLSAVLISKPRWSGAAFGIALSIKIVPVIFLVLFVAYLRQWRDRGFFLGTATLTGIILSLPFLIQDPILIAREVLGYGSIPGRWGWSAFAVAFTDWTPTFKLAMRISAYLLLAAIAWLSIRLNRRENRDAGLFVQMGFIAFVFMSLTSTWGTNYMAWLDPFPVGIGVAPAAIYYASSGLMLSYLNFRPGTEGPTLMFICWASVLVVTRMFLPTFTNNPTGERP